MANKDGFSIMPTQEMSDAADATHLVATSNFIAKHGFPSGWWNAYKDQLPNPGKGMKWAMTRNFDGWSFVRVPKDKYIGQGGFNWEPNPKSKKANIKDVRKRLGRYGIW